MNKTRIAAAVMAFAMVLLVVQLPLFGGDSTERTIDTDADPGQAADAVRAELETATSTTQAASTSTAPESQAQTQSDDDPIADDTVADATASDDAASDDAEEVADLIVNDDQARTGGQPGTGDPVPVQSDGDGEIAIDPATELPATDLPDTDGADTDVFETLSEQGSLACASIEVAIEAARTEDWPRFEELVYRAVPLASASEEIEIARLGTSLFNSLSNPAPGAELNDMINVCVEQGYQL